MSTLGLTAERPANSWWKEGWRAGCRKGGRRLGASDGSELNGFMCSIVGRLSFGGEGRPEAGAAAAAADGGRNGASGFSNGGRRAGSNEA